MRGDGYDVVEDGVRRCVKACSLIGRGGIIHVIQGRVHRLGWDH